MSMAEEKAFHYRHRHGGFTSPAGGISTGTSPRPLIMGDDQRHQNGPYQRLPLAYRRQPCPFQKSLRVTIEHGNQNDSEGDYSSVAYWYQKELTPRFRLPHRFPICCAVYPAASR